MPQYSYKGRKQSGELISGLVDAPDQSSAAQTLMQRNVIPVSITVSQAQAQASESLNIFF